MIAVIDYGAGNLQSVAKALHHIGCGSAVVSAPAELMEAEGAVLPGVGSFGDAMACLERSGMRRAVLEYVSAGKPLLGICLGLQLLFGSSEESPGVAGLGLLEGSITRIPPGEGLKIPPMGWNSLTIPHAGDLLAGVEEGSFVYFVHSYYLHAADRSIVTAQTEYGVTIDAAVQSGNLFAAQFHPEKSGEVGLAMLRNFAALVGGREAR